MEDKFDLIEKYLMNEMSVKEQTEFEDLLRTSSELMKEFKLRKEINEAILEDDVIRLRTSLKEVMKPQNAILKPIPNLFILSSIAAVVILFIVISCMYLFPGNWRSQDDTFKSYYSPYPAIMGFRSPTDQNLQEQLLYRAFNFYDERDFNQAADYFLKVLQSDSSNNMAQFYLSICEIEKDNLDVSIEYLNDLILRNNHIFWEQSNWYLALVYVKKKDTKKAELILKEIVKENMAMRNDAEEILKSLN